MTFNTETFRSLTQNGIWPVTGDGYQSYCSWRDQLIGLVYSFTNKYRYSSSLNHDTPEYERILEYCSLHPEMAIHVLTHDMVSSGCTWCHLMVCYKITGHRNLPEDAGKFYRQLAMWLLYYDSLSTTDQ